MFITKSSKPKEKITAQKRSLASAFHFWFIPLLIGALLLSHLLLKPAHKLAFAQDPSFTVAQREDFPGGQQIPMWTASDGTYLYCGDEFNHYGAWPGATGSIVDPQSYTKLTSATGARGGTYTDEQLRAIDYIIYHGAAASQEKDVYGYTGWKARAITQFALWAVMRGEAHTLAVSVPQEELHQPIERFYTDAVNYAHNNSGGPENGIAKLFVPAGDKQVLFFFGEQSGSLKITKNSLLPAITSNNEHYALEGAVYGVYSDEGCTNLLGSLTLDASASATIDGLPVGCVYVKEISAPKGFLLDPTVHTVEIKNQEESTLAVTDTPIGDFNLRISKQDFDHSANLDEGNQAEQQGTSPQGNATLQGALFKVTYSGSSETTLRTWVFSTDAQGFTSFDTDHKVSGDDLFTLGEKPWLPLGYYQIEEIQAPKGYKLPELSFQTWKLSSQNGNLVWTNLSSGKESSSSGHSFFFKDEVIRGNLKIKKIGHTSLSSSDGYSEIKEMPSLKGAKIELTNNSTQPVFYQAKWVAPHEVVTTVETDESGVAAIKDLPFGSYSLKEVLAPAGYSLNTEWNPTVTLTSEETIEAPELIDERIALQTMLVDTSGSKTPKYTETLNLVDHIKYEGLTPGEEYEITGELYETKQVQEGAAEPIARGAVRFKASTSSGEAAVPFSVRTASLEGKEVTAYETISKDGEKVASHTDSHSEAQTIRVAPKPHLPETADNVYEIPLLFALAGTLLIGCTHLFATKIRRLF
ncbi:SpaA isopeptide-forming pilin-related protein [Lancefieldella parvula]|uniref:SpaA isopeptide-forming pilin-related protein n=1 Tax=Lancefieldella parvula TaxID=1382 RepID=UPI00288AC2ED|nr:SpaA isopeptide-forming pilin-related protein [Lancefieldella parvula]